MILRNTAALPALATLLNGIAGFSAIHNATVDGLGKASIPHLTVAAWLIFLAMGFDSLDGRLARITRRASDFGAQLDSLCDVVSFGVAPAVLMLQTVFMSLGGTIGEFGMFLPQASTLGKAVMAIAVLYVCCAVLRLARFNIEHFEGVLGHMSFSGLPSPGAAAVVAAMVLLFDHLQRTTGWQSADWLNVSVGIALPVTTLLAALLMVSRFRYPHVLNQFVAGRKPFLFIVAAVGLIIIGLFFLRLPLTLALLTILYAAAGPVNALRKRAAPPPQSPPPAPPTAH
jgi:CDP-diacylglycerol--serine O-phosphatidyltransferase